MRKGKQILAIVLSGFLAMGVCQGPVFAVQSGEKSVQAMENEETVFPSEFEETDYIQPEDEEMIVTDETAAVGELYDSEEAPPYEGVPQGFDSSQQEDLPQGSDSSQQEGGFSDADNPPQEEIVEESIETDNPEEKESSDAGEMAEEEKEITESTDEFFEDAPYATNEDSQEDAGVEEYTSDTGSQQEGLTHDADNPPQEETVEESIETDNPEEKENSDGSEMAGEEKEVTESTDDFFEDAPYVNNEDSQADAHSEEYISDTVGDPEDTSRIDGNEITYDDVPEEFTGTDELKASENDSIDLINAVEEAEKTKESMEESLFEEGQEIETTEEQAMFGNIHYDVATEYDGLAYSIRSNCVAFVRYKVPSLPSVGDTLETKKAIINSYTPVAGCVAIETNGYSTGHVSYVEAVNGNTVTTLHGGFQGAINGVDYTNRIIRKTGTPSDLGIVGYWIPGGSSPSQNPTNPTISINKRCFTLSDTIYVKANASNATGYYGYLYKENQKIWEGYCVDGGVLEYSPALWGTGTFYIYISCYNDYGNVETERAYYYVLEDDFYALLTTCHTKGNVLIGAPDGNVQLVDPGYRYHPQQIWRFRKQSDGTYKIFNMYWSGYDNAEWVLSCEGGGGSNNTNVALAKDNGVASQRWRIDWDPNQGFKFIPAHCSLVLDLTSGFTSIGTNIQLYETNESSAQRFGIFLLSKENVTYSRPGKPSASVYNGKTEVEGGKSIALTWTESPKVNDFDKRSYQLQIFDSTGKEILNKSGLTDTKYNYTFNSSGIYSIKITTVNDYYKDYETAGSSTQISVGEVDKEKPVITSVNLIEASADRIVFEIDATDNKEIEYGSICFITYENDSTGQIFGTKDGDDVQLDFLSPSKLRYTLKKAAIDYCKETGQFIGDKQRFYFQVRDKSNNYSERYALDTEIPFGPFYYVDPGDTFTVDDLFGADLGEFWYKRVELNPDCFRKENDQYTAIKAGKSTLVYVHGSTETPAKACTVIVRGLLKINSQPDDQTVDEGAIVKMKASASGDDLKYQWYYQKSGSSKWEKATQTGNSSESITITAEKSLSDARFKCIITDAYDRTVESRAAVLTVNEVIEPDEPVQITSQDVKLAKTSYVYNGIAKKPGVIVTCDGETLVLKTDYTVSYKNNLNAGTATVTITGKGDYTGTVKKTFNITAASIADATITGLKTRTYTGKALVQAPVVELDDLELEKDVDYTVSYNNNINAGTATVIITGKGNCASRKTATFKINKAVQSITAKAAVSSVAVDKTTTVSITGAKGTKSFKSSDTTIATVTSAGKVTAKKVGTVKITATSAATSNYNAASKTVTIKVVPAATASLTSANQATGIKLTWKKVTGANGYKVYRGSTLIKTITSGSTVTYADTKANTNGTKYVYEVVAKASTGDSTLSKSVTTYRVARPAISSVTNSAASKMTIKWGKNAKASGYQIQYSTSKSFASGNKTATITGVSTVSKVIGSLTKGKTYYVRIRTYKTVGSTKYWSTWSASKSVKISK